MSSIPIAHVYLIPIYGESKVTTEVINSILLVRVYISDVTIRTSSNNYRTLLPKFATHLIGHNIRQFDFTEIPQEIAEVFRFVCRQINNGVHMRGLMDDFGRYLFKQEMHGRHETYDRNDRNETYNSSLRRIVTDLSDALVNMSSGGLRHTQYTSPVRASTTVQIQPNIQETQQRNMIGLITQLGQIASLVSRNNAISSSVLQPVHQPAHQSPIPSVNIDDVESPYLQRFTENRVGATREIIPLVEPIQPTQSQTQEPIQPTQPQTQEPILQTTGLQRIRHSRDPVPVDTIQRIASVINGKIIANKAKPPKFSKHTYANYKKIKNFVNQHTSVWLSNNEIKTFISEISKINPSLCNNAVNIDLD